MKIFLPAFLFFFLPQTNAKAQFSKYLIRLKDKVGTPHTIATPSTYLSAKSINRRTRYNIGIDSTDLPITPGYLDSIRLVPNVTILNYSKWLNQVAIRTTDPNAITKINSFPFVISTGPLAARLLPIPGINISANKLAFKQNSTNNSQQNPIDNNRTTTLNYGNSLGQIDIHKGQFIHDLGFLGQNMTIAMMDAGFNTYLTNPGIDSLRINNQIKATWDFVANEASVNEDNSHGFYCLSIIGANKPGQMIGSAPKADFYLFRTEDVASEYPVEEQNWIAAAERADSIGADVFSTSLGYLDFDNAIFDYTYPMRNGNTAMMTRAGDLAAKKGILVFNSAGNNGNGSGGFVDYKYVAVPADGDSVIAVGACTVAGAIANFSAWGPNSNGKVKPNITSVGVSTSYVNLSGTPSNGNGTSFSNPNIAGLVTGLWQAFQELSNMDILNITQEASNLFSAPDGRFGYGIPNMKKAFVLGLKKVYNITPLINSCYVNADFKAKDNGISVYELQRKLPGETVFSTRKTLNASPGAFALKNYNFKDTITSVNFGTVIYRIKHTMGTDTSFFYDEFNLTHNSACVTSVNTINNYRIKIAPNPVGDNLYINLGSLVSNKILIRITDSKGAVLITKQMNARTDWNLNTANWASGIYFVEILDNKKAIFIKKLMKD